MGAFCARTPERRPRLAADGASADGVRSQRRHTSVRAGGGFPPAANKDDIPHAAPGERLCQRGTKAVHLRSCRERFADGEQRRRHTSGRAGRGLPSAWNKDDIPHAAPGERLCRRRTKAARLRSRRERAPVSGEQIQRHASGRAGGGFPPAANKDDIPHAAPGERLCQRGTKAVRLRSRRERFVDGEQRRHTSGRTGRGLLSAGNKNGSAPHAVPGSASASGEQRRCASDRAGSAL